MNYTRNLILAASVAAFMENAYAVEIEPMGKALSTLLNTTKVSKKSVPGSKSGAQLFYTKNGNKVARVAFIEKGVYPPNCTHTWAIGINPATAKVTEVRVIEMSCPHAFPTKAASFLDQFQGKGPADAAKLSARIDTIAKATGSSKLTAEAVTRSIHNWTRLKGKL